jgi:hypothetical protein
VQRALDLAALSYRAPARSNPDSAAKQTAANGDTATGGAASAGAGGSSGADGPYGATGLPPVGSSRQASGALYGQSYGYGGRPATGTGSDVIESAPPLSGYALYAAGNPQASSRITNGPAGATVYGASPVGPTGAPSAIGQPGFPSTANRPAGTPGSSDMPMPGMTLPPVAGIAPLP